MFVVYCALFTGLAIDKCLCKKRSLFDQILSSMKESYEVSEQYSEEFNYSAPWYLTYPTTTPHPSWRRNFPPEYYSTPASWDYFYNYKKLPKSLNYTRFIYY